MNTHALHDRIQAREVRIAVLGLGTVEHARLVVDTRNAFGELLAGDPRYVRA